MNLLTLTLFLPLAGFFLLLLMPRQSKLAFGTAFLVSLATFAVSITLVAPVLANGANLTNELNLGWVDAGGLNIHFHLAVDGINLWLLLLTTLLLPIGIWIAETMIPERRKTFYALTLLFEFGLIGVFSAMDLFVFYVFWEVALIPMYLMVGGFGGSRRGPVAIKFFVYTFAGSVLMLVSILYVHSVAGTFDYNEILAGFSSGRIVLSPHEQLWLFLGFFAAFAVKVPIVPFHTWQPATYVEAPAPATFLLAAVMSKMGAYGLLRFAIGLFPGGAHTCSGWITVLAIIGIIYGALIAFIQPNIKSLIAYSSISHLGFIVLGLFTFSQQGADGAVYQMVAHGISTGALFLLAGYLEQRRGSMEIADFGGLATPAPGFAVAFMIALLASVGLPSLCNFIGEYLVLQGAAVSNHFTWAVWASIGIILSAVYMLWMYQRTFLGKTTTYTIDFPDLTMRDWVPLLPLFALMIWLGTYTQSFMPPISSANARILDQSKRSQEYQVQLYAPGFTTAIKEVAHAR